MLKITVGVTTVLATFVIATSLVPADIKGEYVLALKLIDGLAGVIATAFGVTQEEVK